MFLGVLLVLALAACTAATQLTTGRDEPPAPALQVAEPLAPSERRAARAAEERVSSGALVRLPGARSVDDQTVARFTWVQVEGPTVPLSDPHARTASFVPRQPGTYVFELVVTDNTGLVSQPQTATFVVGNDPPEVQVVSPSTGLVGRQMAVRFTLADSTADLASVHLEFSVDGGQTFQPATMIDRAPPALIGRQSGATSDATRSVAGGGVAHTFVWDAAQDLGTTSRDVFIRLTPMDPSGVVAASGPFTYHPLLDAVVEACGMPSGEWDLSPAAWEALRASLARCQNDLLTAVQREIGSLRLVLPKQSTVGTGAVSRGIDLSPLVATLKTLQQATVGAGPVHWMASEAIARHYADVEAAIAALEERLNTVGDDAQLANIDLQNALQKQQQQLQTLSNVSKVLHDAAMAAIRNIR